MIITHLIVKALDGNFIEKQPSKASQILNEC